jgi:hypothetical protein
MSTVSEQQFLSLWSTQENCFELDSGFTGRSDMFVTIDRYILAKIYLGLMNWKARYGLSWLRMDDTVVHL